MRIDHNLPAIANADPRRFHCRGVPVRRHHKKGHHSAQQHKLQRQSLGATLGLFEKNLNSGFHSLHLQKPNRVHLYPFQIFRQIDPVSPYSRFHYPYPLSVLFCDIFFQKIKKDVGGAYPHIKTPKKAKRKQVPTCLRLIGLLYHIFKDISI